MAGRDRLAAAVAGGPGLCRCAHALGVLGRDRWLTRQVSQRMLEEFPTVAELLVLAVTAGEGPVGALERVQRTSDGDTGLQDR